MNAKRTIFIVDDDPKVRKTLSDILGVRGYAPIAAATGKAALDRVEEEAPAVALIDLKLEDISGLELMREIKERSPGTECIVLTGYATQESAIEAVNLGAYSYEQKPCDMEQLLVTIRRAIEKREAEEALRGSEEKYRTILESIGEGYYEVDIAGNFTFFNDSLCRLIGYPEDELMGMNNRQYMDAETVKKVYQTFNAVYQTGKPAEAFDWELIRKNGTRRFVETSVSLIRDSAGEPAGFQGVVRDITERKRAEEAIRQRTAQLEALRQVGLELTAELDLDTLLRSIVSRAVELLGGTSGGLYLYRPERDVLEWIVPIGFDPTTIGYVLRRGEGLCGRVWETGEPLIVSDYHHWKGRATGWEDYPFMATMGAPVRWGGEFLGVLEVDASPPRTFSPSDAELLGLFATQAAIAIRNARLYEEARRRALEQETVSRIAYTLNTLDVRDAFPVLLEELWGFTGCDVASLAVMDETGEQFVVADLESPFLPPIPPNWGGLPPVPPNLGGPGAPVPPRVGGPGGWGNVMSLSDTAAAEDIEAGRPHLIADLSTETHFPFEQSLHQAGLRSRVILPLLSGGVVFGALILSGSQTGLFREDQLPVLQQIADAVALAVGNSLLFQAEREQRELAEALEAAAAAVSSTLDPDQVLDRILEQVERVVAGDAFNVMLIEDGIARVVRWRGYEHLDIEKRIARFSAPVVELSSVVQMVQTREPVVIPDTSTDPEWVRLEGWEWLRSYVGALIRVGGVTVGVLSVDGTRPGQFGPADAHRLEAFADHAAAAIENSRLFEQAQQEIAERRRAEGELRQSVEQLQRAFEGTVEVLVLAIEMRDPYTAGHQRQVTQLACVIAKEMGLPEEQIQGIHMAGLVHDLGKINIPAEILSKPGKLSDLEFGLIRMHVQAGYDVLKKFDFPWPVAQIVLQHHERMDGSGYPQGLSGGEILLEARLLAVADVVTAMASHRPYRPARGIDKALGEISQNSGVLYDAELVDIFLKLFAEKGFEFE